uniref:Endonuclease/exonuclease/phosphatase n=1 Tax=Solanum tuberosum TaxID=4113 RepID=M1DB27_SOLTU
MVPIWIKLPGLDFKYRSPKGLSKLGSLVGKPLMVDHNTEKKKGLHFAKLLVEVKMDAKLPEVILFKNEKDLIVEQKVLYEWKPTLCCFCSKYGHSEDECRKKKAPVQRQRLEKQVAPLEVTSDVVPIAHGVEVDSQETQVQEK